MLLPQPTPKSVLLLRDRLDRINLRIKSMMHVCMSWRPGGNNGRGIYWLDSIGIWMFCSSRKSGGRIIGTATRSEFCVDVLEKFCHAATWNDRCRFWWSGRGMQGPEVWEAAVYIHYTCMAQLTRGPNILRNESVKRYIPKECSTPYPPSCRRQQLGRMSRKDRQGMHLTSIHV